MSLADFAAIAVAIFSSYILLWAVVFIVVCVLLAIFTALVLLAMSRI